MTVGSETLALVALLRFGRRRHQDYLRLVEQAGSAQAVLDRELGTDGPDGTQAALFAPERPPWLDTARAELVEWLAADIDIVTVLDEAYPTNLREVHDRPPLVFVAGTIEPADSRSIAIIGARRASPEGLRLAADFAVEFVRNRYTVISGLAAGIDTAAHEAALSQGGRTIAVIGTGLLHESYPPSNAGLQHDIAARSAVLSQFWPHTAPTQKTFPMRNAVMSGLSRGSVVIEASERSGARVQARLALAHGRPVFLLERLMAQTWARELASHPDVHIVRSPEEVCRVVEHGPPAEETTRPEPSSRAIRPPTRTSWRQ